MRFERENTLGKDDFGANFEFLELREKVFVQWSYFCVCRTQKINSLEPTHKREIQTV